MWGRNQGAGPGEVVRVFVVAVWKFWRDRGPVRASALAFSTALSLVPLLALVFAILKGLGVQKRLEPIILQYFAAGNEQLVSKVVEYVDRTQVAGLGLVGTIGFFMAALSVLGNVEQAFNDIWGVDRGRNLIRRITDYTAILIACPILIITSTSMATTIHVSQYLDGIKGVESALPFFVAFIPYLAKSAAFAAAYLIMPNHKVGIKAALIGGAVAGAFFHGAELGYITFQVMIIPRYNAIYGTLAQLPLFLIWVYLGWCIALVGAELTCVMELPGRGRYLMGGRELWSPRLGAALPILAEVATRFVEGKPPKDSQALIDSVGIHPVEGRRVITFLMRAGILTEGEAGVVPNRSPESTSMGALLQMVAAPGGSDSIGMVEADFVEPMSKIMEGKSWASWAVEQKKD